jgi:hypothetical protein
MVRRPPLVGVFLLFITEEEDGRESDTDTDSEEEEVEDERRLAAVDACALLLLCRLNFLQEMAVRFSAAVSEVNNPALKGQKL